MARQAARIPTSLEVRFEGGFFERDPAKTIGHNIELMLEQLAAESEATVKALIERHRSEMPHWTGWTRDHVVGRVRSTSGKRWYRHAAVSVSTAGMSARLAKRTKAAGASIERRFRPFRLVARVIRRHRADLTAGLS